ncbi:MAG: DUF805 domain-containing protein [Rothia sp. (in: high G+C Gram-positive bacteria)]|nr:DUF805 domain-containing protein [Rothia sp. (in: high G+C Gram-positive bacteria)]
MAENHYPAPYLQPQPRSSVSFKQALRNNRKYLWHFSGRASRSEFWKAWGLWAIVCLVPLFLGYIGWILIVFNFTPENNSNFSTYILTYFFCYAALVLILGLTFILMTLSLGWRRLQDAGFPGALWLLTFIGVGIVPLVMCMMPASPNGINYDSPQDVNRP